ncbi:MAG TPA: hypothetical protein VFN49_13195 [Candidatus Aquilonibacter sp.]|nr:hypothetical protein [Candidatus Aquilonibacter sp.]
MADSPRSARSVDVATAVLAVAIAALYAIDFSRHGLNAAWHLLFLLLLGGPRLYDAFVGIELSKMHEQGEREYYFKYANLSPQQAEEHVRRAQRVSSYAVACAVIVLESVCALLGKPG